MSKLEAKEGIRIRINQLSSRECFWDTNIFLEAFEAEQKEDRNVGILT